MKNQTFLAVFLFVGSLIVLLFAFALASAGGRNDTALSVIASLASLGVPSCGLVAMASVEQKNTWSGIYLVLCAMLLIGMAVFYAFFGFFFIILGREAFYAPLLFGLYILTVC